jgi:L-ribulose-5-phosphate 3-epimerase
MNSSFSRRDFLKVSSTAAVLASVAPVAFAQAPTKRELKKAIMFATIRVEGSILEKFKAVKAAGFAGVEAMSHLNQEEVLAAAKETGLSLPSVCCDTHWKNNLASADAAERQRGFQGLKQTLQDAKKYGATSVLFVPCSVNEKVSYTDAYARSQQELRKALPIAEECGVKIAIENVWNNFLLSPLELARYIDEFKSPWIGAHFDVGNVLRYGWPEQWISVLGKRIQKFHIKEFSRKKMQSVGLGKGFDVDLLEGDNNWPAVMKAIDQTGYNGWIIAEQRGADSPEGLKKISAAMDKIIAS